MYVPSRAALNRCVSEGALPVVIKHCCGCALLVAAFPKLSQAVDIRESKRIFSNNKKTISAM
jgi:hypothetical protein